MTDNLTKATDAHVSATKYIGKVFFDDNVTIALYKIQEANYFMNMALLDQLKALTAAQEKTTLQNAAKGRRKLHIYKRPLNGDFTTDPCADCGEPYASSAHGGG